MFKTKTLNDILYKDQHYTKGASINVDDEDVNKLIIIGAIAGEIKQPEVKINVIRNPIEPKEEFKEVKTGKINWETGLQAESKEEKKRVKRKYTKRSDNADTDSKGRRDTARFRK